MKKFLFVLILLSLLVLPVTAAANEIENIADDIADALFYIGIALVAVMVIWAGILFVTSAGDPDKMSNAKRALIYAIVGAVVIAIGRGAYGVVTDIVGELQ